MFIWIYIASIIVLAIWLLKTDHPSVAAAAAKAQHGGT